jgi:hypothetical protein
MLTLLTLSTILPLIYAQDYTQQVPTWIVGNNVEVIGNRIIWKNLATRAQSQPKKSPYAATHPQSSV